MQASLEAIHITVQRIVPAGSGKAIASIDKSGVGGVIGFGTKKLKPPSKLTPFKDRYSTERVADKKEVPDILSSVQGMKGDIAKFFTYDSSKAVNQLKGISVWGVYSTNEFKRLLCSFIGCPLEHVILLDSHGYPLGSNSVVKGGGEEESGVEESSVEECSGMYTVDGGASGASSVVGASLTKEAIGDGIMLEQLVPVSTLDETMNILIRGDWVGRNDVALWPEEVGTEMTWFSPMSSNDRSVIMQQFLQREETILGMSKGAHTLFGKITRTTMNAHVEEKGLHYIATDRVFHLLTLDRVDDLQSAATPKSWLIGLVLNDEGKTIAKGLKNYRISPDRIAPSMPGALSALMLMRTPISGGKSSGKSSGRSSGRSGGMVHADYQSYVVTIGYDFSSTVETSWTQGFVGQTTGTMIMLRSMQTFNQFLDRLYQFLEEDTMSPGSRLPSRRNIVPGLSITSYQESYSGGNFGKFQQAVSKLAQADLIKIAYITSASIYFQLPHMFSRERLFEIRTYLQKREANSWPRVYRALRTKEALDDLVSYTSKGPIVMAVSDGKDLSVIVTGCKGEWEITRATEYVGSLASLGGYKANLSEAKSEQARDHTNLALLEQIDLVMFGSKLLPGGKRVNFSRLCQGATRHPVPIPMSEALAGKNDGSIAILNNMTYGGPQAYKCPSPENPIMSYRPEAFGENCVICCTKTSVESSSLKWNEQRWCMKRMLFDQTKVPDVGHAKITLHSKPVHFDGQYLGEGRLAGFPPGVREVLPSNLYLFNPPGVDVSSIHEVIEWVTEEDIDKPPSVRMAESAVNYCSTALTASGKGKDGGEESTVCQPISEQSARDVTLEEMLADYIARGVYILVIKLTPVGTKTWSVSYFETETLLEASQSQQPLVIATWSIDQRTRPSIFYPVVNRQGEPATSSELGLLRGQSGGVGSAGSGKGKRSGVLFMYDVLGSIFTISGALLHSGRCIGVHVSASGSGGAATPFFLPVRPVKAPVLKESMMDDIVLPTAKQLEGVFKEAQKQLGYYTPVARRIIYGDSKLKTVIGFTLSPDMVTIYMQPSAHMPKGVDTESATALVASPEYMNIIWGTAPSQLVPMEVTGAVYNRLTLKVAESYLAHKIVKYGLIPRVVTAMQKVGPSGPNSVIVGAMGSLLEKECTRFVCISDKIQVHLHGGSLVMFGEKIQLPRPLYQAAVKRLCTYCPKNIAFVSNYFACFPSIIGDISVRLQPWEKLYY